MGIEQAIACNKRHNEFKSSQEKESEDWQRSGPKLEGSWGSESADLQLEPESRPGTNRLDGGGEREETKGKELGYYRGVGTEGRGEASHSALSVTAWFSSTS